MRKRRWSARRRSYPGVIESLGCEVSHDLDATIDADVVYVLRMQRERMTDAFVPSLREYTTLYGITPERVREGQLVMHPGPMNRGIEIDPRVADSDAALVTDQVRAGLVVRMAVLYDVLTAAPATVPVRGPCGGRLMLVARNGRSDSLTLEGRVLAPAQGIDESLRITVTDGVISAIEPGQPGSVVVAPAFVDPHVHLRTPGREDEETIGSGTEAAAAGGYCALLAMPNTEPVVDSAAVLGALHERARESAVVPVGFMAAISKGQSGEELTEMAELASNGAAAFTDDGKPVVSAGLLRRALQYSALTDLRLALHCEEPSLSRGGHMHEGAVSAELGIGPYPSSAESVMVERDLALASTESRPVHLMHLSARESVEALERALAAGVEATAEVTPHHLVLTDEAVRSLDPNVKMNPPLRASTDREALRDALRRGSIPCIGTDHAPHARQEKDVPFEEAPFGVIGLETAFASLYTQLVLPGELSLETLLERMSTGPARAFGLDEPRIEVGARANLVALDLDAEWTVTEDGFRSLSANSWLLGETLRGRVVTTLADGRLVFEA